jgi:hypothetical protein
MSARNVPAAQKPSQNADPLAAVHEPGGQSRHDARPLTGLYAPGGQGTPARDPLGQNLPIGHGSVDVGDEQKEPASHGAQVAMEAAPVALEYVPSAQGCGAMLEAGQ